MAATKTAGLCAAAALGLAGCGLASPSQHAAPSPSPTATATPTPLPSAVTVLAPDGVNFRSGPSSTASVVGIVAQGVTLPVLGQNSADGGWWEVKGSTATGWITSNPADTSTGSFQSYSAGGTNAWSVMFPTSWSFAQSSSGAITFTAPGGEVITVVTATTVGALPPGAPSGTGQKSVSSVDVYGITTSLVTYAASSGYLAAVAFQAAPGLAFLITDKASQTSAAQDFSVFLDTFKFPLPAPSPSP